MNEWMAKNRIEKEKHFVAVDNWIDGSIDRSIDVADDYYDYDDYNDDDYNYKQQMDAK